MVLAQEASLGRTSLIVTLASGHLDEQICTLVHIALNSETEMSALPSLTCDGCGGPASSEHIARRLQRLEWSTRFRPVHIQTLFLGAVAPLCDDEFVYRPNGRFTGEAGHLLSALRISADGKTPESVHAEVQRAGAFLTHILECPLDTDFESTADWERLMLSRLEIVAIRIRRSLRPKRVVPISREFGVVLKEFVRLDLGCTVCLDDSRPYLLENLNPDDFAARVQGAAKISSAT